MKGLLQRNVELYVMRMIIVTISISITIPKRVLHNVSRTNHAQIVERIRLQEQHIEKLEVI